jgi:hypothetical protein
MSRYDDLYAIIEEKRTAAAMGRCPESMPDIGFNPHCGASERTPTAPRASMASGLAGGVLLGVAIAEGLRRQQASAEAEAKAAHRRTMSQLDQFQRDLAAGKHDRALAAIGRFVKWLGKSLSGGRARIATATREAQREG